MKIYENLRKSTKNQQKSTKIDDNQLKSIQINENLYKSSKINESNHKNIGKMVGGRGEACKLCKQVR